MASGGIGGPIDWCLVVAATLPVPEGTSERDRDVLWATITRIKTGRSMADIGKEYGISGGAVRAIACRVMAAQGIQGLRCDDPAYRNTHRIAFDLIRANPILRLR